MSEVNNRKTILIISQTFVPDPAAVGSRSPMWLRRWRDMAIA
jgi:hypothetical protein